MHPLHLLAYLGAGAFVMNAIPHLVSGLMGRRFPSPFAKPRGRGQSSARVNMLWGFANLVAAWFLIFEVGNFNLANPADAAALALGMFLLGFFCASHFGSLNNGHGPGLA
jgi:hypothetical protein